MVGGGTFKHDSVRITYQCCSEKTINITYSVCVFLSLGIEYAMRMHYIVICGLPVSKIFFHIFSKIARLSKKVIEHKICILILSTTFARNISHCKKKWARYGQNCKLVSMWSACYFLSDFNETWNFFDRFSESTQISNFMNIRPVGTELFHSDRRTDGETDIAKLIVAFCNFANAPKNVALRTSI